MLPAVTVASYAKLNYTLDVLSRRSDGFHDLASVMQTVSLADTLTVQRSDARGISMECDAPDVPSDATNLAVRAAAAALEAAGSAQGLHIRLDKRIPAQSGLGGGSSNAAAALRAVDALLDLGLPRERMMRLAADLGSDVPFFLVGGTAVVRGKGDSVTALDDGPALWFVVARPDVGVPTGPAYAALDSMPNRVSVRATRRMQEDLAAGSTERVMARMANDFEQVVFEHYLPVALAMDDLMMARARSAHLCGSGSAVFGVALNQPEAEAIARTVRRKYDRAYVCRTVGREEALASEVQRA